MTLLYLMSFLDRVNVGTAKLTGELFRDHPHKVVR